MKTEMWASECICFKIVTMWNASIDEVQMIKKVYFNIVFLSCSAAFVKYILFQVNCRYVEQTELDRSLNKQIAEWCWVFI